jgi:ribosome biogenesis GTPase A
MAKTRRMLAENLKLVDVVLELRDARIPISSMNPEILTITGGKPLCTLLTKASLADPAQTARYLSHLRRGGRRALAVDCITGEGIGAIAPAVREILGDKLARYAEKGMQGRTLKAMIVGIPNVGKSSLVNRLCGAKKAKVENRPGVTLDKQWAATSSGIDLLDTPGVLWPKFDDPAVGDKLAFIGSVKDEVTDSETMACRLISTLQSGYLDLLCERYKLERADVQAEEPYTVLELIGAKRGMKMRGGDVDTERAAIMLLDEYRGGKLGRISFEQPEIV